MTYEQAKAIFLLEHCGERCDGLTGDDICKSCEIAVAINALDAVQRVGDTIAELEEQRYYKAAEIVRKAAKNKFAAYDVDKVIEQLEEYIEEYSELDENGLHNLKWCAMQEALDVVKRGGK